jgi:hypothetical protein
VGTIELEAIHGDPSTPVNEADIGIEARLTDVRLRSDLSDYPGDVAAVLNIRLTELANGAAGGPQTVDDFPFDMTVPCSTNGDATMGSTCALTTTADTLIPGAATEQNQAMWQIDTVRVYDGGSDGDVGTAGDNTPFETQGIFIP